MNSKRIPKYKQKFNAARVGMRCSIWMNDQRHYGKIVMKHEDADDPLKHSYIQIEFEGGSRRKFKLGTLAGYGSFRLELNGLEKAAFVARGEDYETVTTGGKKCLPT